MNRSADELDAFPRLETCFACGHSGIVSVGRFRYPRFQAEFVPEPWRTRWLPLAARLVRCTACGSQGPQRRPTAALLEAWYARQRYTTEDQFSNGHLAVVRAQRAGVFGAASELVDIGTGSGAFLDRVLQPVRAHGLEPSRASVASARARGRHVVEPDATGWTPELPERVDVITLFDVVEHLIDPRELLTSAAARLNRPGWLVVFTGDAGSQWARRCGARWWYHGWAGHLSCFSARGLVTLLESLGGRCMPAEQMRYAEQRLGIRARARDALAHARIASRFAGLKDRLVAPLAQGPFGDDHVLVIAKFE